MRTEVKFWIITTYIGKQALCNIIRHHIALGKIPKRRAKLAVGAAVLGNNNISQLRVTFFNIYGVLQKLIIAKHYLFASFSHGQGDSIQSNFELFADAKAESGPNFS